MQLKLIGENKLFIILIFGLLSFIFSNVANAQVRISNFNVIQRIIPSTSSSVDFRLTISQQDQNLDCSNLPLTNGNLEWVVWYEVTGGYTTIIRKQTVGLPLSPNPKPLDFQTSVRPTQRAIQAGGITFRAALGCVTYIAPNNLSRNLAVSAPIRVSVSGGGTPGDSGGRPGSISVPFEITNPIATESLVDLAKAIGRFLFQIAIPIAVIVIIYAGILYLTSGGKPEQIKKATAALKYALIGLAIILIGQGFFTLIKSILDLGTP